MQESDSDAPSCDNESSEDESSNLPEVDAPSVSDNDIQTDHSTTKTDNVSTVTATEQKKHSGRGIWGWGVSHGNRARGRGRCRGRGKENPKSSISCCHFSPNNSKTWFQVGDSRWSGILWTRLPWTVSEKLVFWWIQPVLTWDYFHTFFSQKGFSIIAKGTNQYA